MGRKQRGGNSGGGGNSSGGRGSNNKSKQNHSSKETTTKNDNDALLSDDYEDDENLDDFCQRFFGDPLFSNRNVAILFLFATVLPMVAWIPHFVKEYRRVKQIQYLEEERQLRMQKARMEVEQQRQIEHMVQQQQQQPGGGGLVLNDITIDGEIRIIQQGSKSTVIHTPSDNYYEAQQQLLDGGTSDNIFSRQTAQEKFPPTLCPDGKTIGYDNWFTLRDAISEVNAIAAEEFLRYNEYLMINSQATGGGSGGGGEKNTNLPVYNPPEPFVVCPGVTLNQKSIWGSILSPSYWVSSIYSVFSFGSSSSSSSSSTPTRAKSKNKLSSIFINAEDITIECVMCTVDLPGTHFSFGPHAKNVKIKGFTFRGATSSSLTFHHHGADVHLEDCYWLWNTGGVVGNSRAPHAKVNVNDGMNGSPPPGSSTTAGAVADLNSTSTVAFYRCVIDDQKQSPRKATVGAGVANVPGMNPPAGHNIGGGSSQGVASSSFTIRN